MPSCRSATRLRSGTSLASLGIAAALSMMPVAALAQDAAATPPAPPAPSPVTGPAQPADVAASQQEASEAGANNEIVVTGTLFRRTDRETPSPVTVLSADDLAKRGVTTIADAIGSLSANNAGALPTAFSANGAFASGASGASLRGLFTDSTLVLFDGLRAAYYPLADDAARNFVDLNTIPDSIVDRVEVLKDGASATYGADAIAGVINVIIKKQITGVQGTAEAGISKYGDAPEQRLTLTVGHGDLSTDGYNVYLNAEYQRDGQLDGRDRNLPYNQTDLSGYRDGGPVTGGNGAIGLTGLTSPGSAIVGVVRPGTITTPGDFTNLVNPAFTPATNAVGQTLAYRPIGGSCGGLVTNTLQSSDTAEGGTVCQQDLQHDYGVIQPQQTRFGVTGHVTVQVGDNAQAYAVATFYQDKVFYTGTPPTIRATSNINGFSTGNLALPAHLTDGSLNPNDPFAAQGYDAQIFYRFGDIANSVTDLSRTFRGATGIDGTFGDWTYSAALTGMHTTLNQTQRGYLYIPHLLSAIADGSYNFVDPSQNTDDVRSFISPDNKTRATSDLAQIQATIGRKLFDLPGGPLQLAISGSARYEKVDDPSANPDGDYFTINGFSAAGHRRNEGISFELDAPVFNQLEIDASGRYDHYSEGFHHFSPKIGAKFKPIPQVAFRGTYSKGFRVPSFPETSGSAVGYVSVTPGGTSSAAQAAFAAQHLNPDGTVDDYAKTYSLGLNTIGTPGLKPETSRNFTGGMILQPVRWFSATVDYYNIRKNNVITGAQYSNAINAYYAGDPIPSGLSVVEDVEDPQHPDAPRRIAIINQGYINANKLSTSGIDIEAQATIPLTAKLKLQSSGEATYVIKFDQTYPDGTTDHYAGTLGPYAITSASGTPRWRANWQNSLTYGPATFTTTAYWTGGYKGTADDYSGAGTSGDCANAVSIDDNGNPTQCHVKHFLDVDMTGALKVNDKLTVYANVLNVFNAHAPFDPNTYGGNNYNPAWAEAGVLGRFMRVGAHVAF